MAYYELKLFVDSTDTELVRLYEAAIKKHNDLFYNTKMKEREKYYDAGFDLYCPSEMVLDGGSFSVKIDQSVICSMQMFTTYNGTYNVGYYLYPRSSTGLKTPLRLSNSVGIIDSGYRGNITAVFDNITNGNGNGSAYTIEKYQRLVQICPPDLSYPYMITLVSTLKELSGDTVRGSSGFGSSGK